MSCEIIEIGVGRNPDRDITCVIVQLKNGVCPKALQKPAGSLAIRLKRGVPGNLSYGYNPFGNLVSCKF